MFKFDRIIKQTLILIVITCFSVSPSLAKTGKGELKLSKDAMEVVLMYMYGAGNKKYSGNAKRKNKPNVDEENSAKANKIKREMMKKVKDFQRNKEKEKLDDEKKRKKTIS